MAKGSKGTGGGGVQIRGTRQAVGGGRVRSGGTGVKTPSVAAGAPVKGKNVVGIAGRTVAPKSAASGGPKSGKQIKG